VIAPRPPRSGPGRSIGDLVRTRHRRDAQGDSSSPDAEETLVRISVVVLAAAAAFAAVTNFAYADGEGDPAAVKQEDGKYLDERGTPTYKVQPGGTVDWYTYSGYRRYHSDCSVCHGPDGDGSKYGPAMTDALKKLTYEDFLGIVAAGTKSGLASQANTHTFGTVPHVMCYVDDLYVYLRARANDAVGRGRPSKRQDKPENAHKSEDNCLGSK